MVTIDGADPRLAEAARGLLGDRRLLIATNRGPVTFVIGPEGLRPRRGSGGLVTALSQVGRYVPLTWVASALSDGDRRAAAQPELVDRLLPEQQMRLRFAAIDRAAYEGAYSVIANPLLWFLQHQLWDLPERPSITEATLRAWETGYVSVNRTVARALVRLAAGDRAPRMMLHDYHLYLAGSEIRRLRPAAVLSHFTHIPWPPSSLWQPISPVIREGIVAGLAANDVVGF